MMLLVLHFGSWPEWIDLFFETARRNPSIDFLVVTDVDARRFAAPNIHLRRTSFEEYVDAARQRLGIRFDPPDAYKLCDLRPMFGELHEEDFSRFDFYGWSDTDLLLGDIRRVYTAELLRSNDVISSHSDRISGHFALFRNTPRNRAMYKHIYGWQTALANPKFVGIDEHGISNAYFQTVFDKANERFGWRISNPATRVASRRRLSRIHLVEQYTTPFLPRPWLDGTVDSAQPDVWFYRDGHITNDRDEREFLYLHFMNFKSSRWRHDGTSAPWEGASSVCRATPDDMTRGIVIDKFGIAPVRALDQSVKRS